MRGIFSTFLLCLVGAVFLSATADAAQRTRFRKNKDERPGKDQSYSLEDIMDFPKEYMEREVVFYARYASNSNLFKPVSTRFNVNQHINFAVWPDKAILWDVKERKNVLPTLYVAKNDEETIKSIRNLRRYELIAVTGFVLNAYAGYPWIHVTKVERIEKPSDRLSEQSIEHMQSGYDALRADSGGVAARHFEQAIQFGLPCEYRAKAYEHLAQAYLLDNKLDRARGYLRQAVQVDKGDAVLHLALADVALRMSDPGEAIAHATFALERSGRYPQAYGIKGEAMSLLGDYGKAFADLNTAAGTPGITIREKAMVNIRRARIYTRSDRYPDAARVYAAASEPGEPLAGEGWLHNEIGLFYERLYLESGDARYLDSAYAAFEEGSRIDSLDPAILYNMTEVEFRRQRLADEPDYAKVQELIDRINQIEPDYAPARILEGRLLYNQGKMEEAEFRYQSVSGQIGSDPMALLALSEAYVDLGRTGDASTAASRARGLQPWNHRVQALGKFLEDKTATIASAYSMEPTVMQGYEGADYGEYMSPQDLAQPYEYVQPGGQYHEYEAAQPGVIMEGGAVEQYVEPQMLPELAPESETQPELQADPTPAKAVRQGRVKRHRLASQESLRPGNPAAEKPRMRPPTHTLAAANGAPGQSGRGQGVGISSSGLIRHESDKKFPQEIQASAVPAMAPGKGRNRFPVTEVRLPESRTAGKRPESAAKDRKAAAPVKSTDGKVVQPLDLGFNPGAADKLEQVAKPDFGTDLDDDFNADFGRGYRWDGLEGREPGDDDDEYIDFGMIGGVHGAYASIPVPDAGMDRDTPTIGADAVRIPKAFSFEPDSSPVILASVSSPGSGDRDLPARNANVYRRFHGGRQVAQIIEREPVTPRPNLDTPAMVSPAGGAMPRTEVKLPSSSRGVGMVSDYASER